MSSCPNMYPALNQLDPSVSAKRDEVTNEPCIALNRDPPKTAATPNMWNGCISILCSA